MFDLFYLIRGFPLLSLTSTNPEPFSLLWRLRTLDPLNISLSPIFSPLSLSLPVCLSLLSHQTTSKEVLQQFRGRCFLSEKGFHVVFTKVPLLNQRSYLTPPFLLISSQPSNNLTSPSLLSCHRRACAHRLHHEYDTEFKKLHPARETGSDLNSSCRANHKCFGDTRRTPKTTARPIWCSLWKA